MGKALSGGRFHTMLLLPCKNRLSVQRSRAVSGAEADSGGRHVVETVDTGATVIFFLVIEFGV